MVFSINRMGIWGQTNEHIIIKIYKKISNFDLFIVYQTINTFISIDNSIVSTPHFIIVH